MAERKTANYSVLKRQQYLSLTDIAYNVLLEAIINQDFQPGAAISIDNLAKQLNMSNTPVREALMRAHGERLVAQKTNRGFVVSDVLNLDELEQLFEARHVLEVHALTVANITTESVEVIRDLVEQMAASGDGTVYDHYREFMALDRQLHRELIKLSNNDFLLAAWEGLHVHLHLSRLYIGVGLFDRSDSTKEHQAILEALEQIDRSASANLLSDHIKSVEKRIQTLLIK